MEILLWVVFGAFVGAVASEIMGTRAGFIADVAIGIIGAVLGGYVMQILGGNGVVALNPIGFVVAVGGACLLIILSRMFRAA